jgi:hypothetical protein
VSCFVGGTSFGTIYSRDFVLYVLYVETVPVPQTPLANKLFVNTRCQPWRPAAWPVPLPVTRGRPNPAHRRHPHTMGDGACAWFGRPPTTARVVGTAREGEKNVTGWECAATDVWGVY